VSRGTAHRPIRSADEEAALQAAMRQALERGAATAAAGRPPDPDPAAFGGQVRPTAPARAVSGVLRSRVARGIVRVKRTRKKEAAPAVPVADPRGRGGKVDVRA
jgi:hypothetical protein